MSPLCARGGQSAVAGFTDASRSITSAPINTITGNFPGSDANLIGKPSSARSIVAPNRKSSHGHHTWARSRNERLYLGLAFCPSASVNIAWPSRAQERTPIAQQIAKAYGLVSFGNRDHPRNWMCKLVTSRFLQVGMEPEDGQSLLRGRTVIGSKRSR